MFGISATTAVGLATAGLGAYSSYKGSQGAGSQTSSTQQQLDPRIQSMLFGKDGSTGLLDKYQGYLDQPQSDPSKAFATANGDYLTNYGAGGLGAIQGAATGLIQPHTPALASLPAYAVGNQVQAPSQNGMDLTGSYNRLINGTPGANPYLDQSIDGAIKQNQLGFGQMMSDATDNLQRNILPGIRSNSVLTGQYGGSRQGVAEGNALGDFGKAMASAANQFGQNATNASVGAKAAAYDADSNRALAATQGLGAQQYGVASQDAATKNAAEFMNVNNSFDASKTNAAATNQMSVASDGSTLAGAGLLGGLMGQASSAVTAQDNYGLNRATQVNGLLAPYMSANAGSTSTQPVYQNTAGGILGGVTGALGLYNQFKGMGSTDYNSIRNNDNYGTNTGNIGVFGSPTGVSPYAGLLNYQG